MHKTTSDNAGQGFSRSRRRLLQALPLLALPFRLLAQGAIPVAVRKLHSFDIRVRDVGRSLAFYQALFGVPVQARQGESVCLRIGEGPHFFSLSPAGRAVPGISHIGLSVANFDVERVQAQLAVFGIEPGPAPQAGDSPLARAGRSWVVTRGPGQGGARDGTRELYFADVEGITYHLTAIDYCGGSGPRGTVCDAAEAPPEPGMFELVDLSHFTNFMSNRDRANDFHTRSFGKTYQAYQGPGSPVIGVGDGIQFLMYVGGDQSGPPRNPGRIDHACFSVTDFDVAAIRARLTDYGLRPRPEGGDTAPLMHWISLRMPNRGGAEGGTPELYFSDPDGIHIQLQDPGYCGGGGYLGDLCPPLA